VKSGEPMLETVEYLPNSQITLEPSSPTVRLVSLRMPGKPPIVEAAPILASAMVLLVFAGLVGIGYLSALAGSPLPGFEWTARFFDAHWFMMIYGFTTALVGMELLTLLSLEWSGRIAPAPLRTLFLALLWAGQIAYLAGHPVPGLVLAAASLLVLAGYAWKSLMVPSSIGLPPGHYNLLVSLAPAVTAVLTLAYIPLGDDVFFLSRASTVFIVLAIIAVLSRDVPLLLGVRPTKEYIRLRPVLARRAKAAYLLALAGIILASATHAVLQVVGGLLLVASAAASLASLGLPQALEASSKGIPVEIKRNLRVQVLLAHAWLAIAGLMAVAGGAGWSGWPVWDVFTHAITLGFMFNIIMGVDAVLLYGHAGIPLEMVPKPSPVPSILLNAGILVRLVHAVKPLSPALMGVSGLLAGAGILLFYGRNMARIIRILRGGGG